MSRGKEDGKPRWEKDTLRPALERKQDRDTETKIGGKTLRILRTRHIALEARLLKPARVRLVRFFGSAVIFTTHSNPPRGSEITRSRAMPHS